MRQAWWFAVAMGWVSSAYGQPVDVALPAVPVSVLATSPPLGPSSLRTGPATVEIVPGVNRILSVAQGHLNRIVTPFEQPRVRTASSVETQVVDNIVYIAPGSDAPVTLYITPAGDEETALSLTLAPKRIPPVEVRLKLAGTVRSALRASAKKAEHWETSQPYVDTFVDLFSHLARESMPDGYSIAPAKQNSIAELCGQPAVEYRTGQVLTGWRVRVYIGIATSATELPVELDERACAAESVLAVASWPRLALYPGQPVELYVAVRHDPSIQVRSRRPSLLRRLESLR